MIANEKAPLGAEVVDPVVTVLSPAQQPPAFRHGMPPHGGFAIGLERWVARIVGAANLRETTLFPRDLNRLTP